MGCWSRPIRPPNGCTPIGIPRRAVAWCASCRARDETRLLPWCRIVKDGANDIAAITKANPAAVTSTAHGYSTGDIVYIADVGGMVELTDGEYTVTVTSDDAFTLDGINSSAYTVYTSGGTIQGKALIYSDIEEPVFEFDALVSNPFLYPPKFVMCLALKLAGLIAISVTNGDQFGVGRLAMQRYKLALEDAMATLANEERHDPPPQSEFTGSR